MNAGTKLFFTTPSQIVGTLWRLFATGAIWKPLGVSASGFALGLALAIVVGLPLGVLIGRSRTLNAMLDPFITAFNATPRLVFLPLVMLWFGLGLWTKVVIVFIGALFPILINTYEGVRNADRTLINVVRSFGASEWDVARLVVVPNAMPYIIAGLRLAIGRAVLGVVVAEFFGSESGLGVMMVQAAGRYQVDVVFSGLIVFAALSLAMTGWCRCWRTGSAGGGRRRRAGNSAVRGLEAPRQKQKAPAWGPSLTPSSSCTYTAILAALTGRALTTFRAGLALKVISSPLNGLTPFRSLVAAFLMTTNLAKPGTTNTPFFFSSL